MNLSELKVGSIYTVNSPANGFYTGELVEPFTEKSKCIFFKVQRWLTDGKGVVIEPLFQKIASDKYVGESQILDEEKHLYVPVYKYVCEQKIAIKHVKIKLAE